MPAPCASAPRSPPARERPALQARNVLLKADGGGGRGAVAKVLAGLWLLQRAARAH